MVAIVTSPYEGLPPDNARAFVKWVQGLDSGALDGVRFAVFGCGNKDWARTYQAVPTLVDANLARCGAKRLVQRGEANARADFFGDFEDWYKGFWGPVAAEFNQTAAEPQAVPLLQVQFTGAARDPILGQNQLQLGIVVANRELVNLKARMPVQTPPRDRVAAGHELPMRRLSGRASLEPPPVDAIERRR